MKLQLEPADLDSLADLLAERVLARLADRAAAAPPPTTSKLFLTEREVADLLAVSAHTLKRARLAGEISAATTTRPIRYGREQLQDLAEWVRRR